MRLPAQEFLRRYLQHVLPRGFHKVRSYGLLSPAYRSRLCALQDLWESRVIEPMLAQLALGKVATAERPRWGMRCPRCEDGVL